MEISNDKILHEDIIKVIENNEAIVATNVSIKEGHRGECWKIVDEFDLAEDENCIQYNKWNHTTSLVAETIAVLDLEQIVVSDMKHAEEGSIKVRMD